MGLNSGFVNNKAVVAFGGKVTQLGTTETLAGGTLDTSDLTYTAPYGLTGEIATSGDYKRTIIKRGFSSEKKFDEGSIFVDTAPSDNDQGQLAPDGP